ncbi:MAG TPA: DUF2804 domain-containing protein [Archangium sp.]|nr:DUF2804 domain-containing protein [Archangium sp.]
MRRREVAVIFCLCLLGGAGAAVFVPGRAFATTPSSRTGLLPAPARLPQPGEGPPAWGRYAGPIADTDTRAWDADLIRRRTWRKSWMFLGAYTERYTVGFSIVDAGYAATAFAYAHDRQTGRLVEAHTVVPLGFADDFQPGLRKTWSVSALEGTWTLEPAGEGWRATFQGPRFSLTLDTGAASQGMSVLAPAQERPFHHTFKAASLPTQVTFQELTSGWRASAVGVLDFSKGYPPRNTFWNWASLVGRTEDGRSFGLNLTAEFNNALENAVWVDGQLVPLGTALFRYEPAAVLNEWKLSTADGVLDLRFFPEGLREDRIMLGAFESRFQQPFGRFEGTLRLNGQTVRVTGSGVTEQHWATW